jgi:hypothetical protein
MNEIKLLFGRAHKSPWSADSPSADARNPKFGLFRVSQNEGIHEVKPQFDKKIPAILELMFQHAKDNDAYFGAAPISPEDLTLENTSTEF